MRNDRAIPPVESRRGLSTSAFQLVLDLHKSHSVKVHRIYHFYRFGLLRIYRPLNFLFVIIYDFSHPLIAQNITITVDDTVVHRGLLTAFYTDRGFTALVLRQGCHNGEPQLAVPVKSLYIIIDKEHLNAERLQLSGVLQGVNRIPRKA